MPKKMSKPVRRLMSKFKRIPKKLVDKKQNQRIRKLEIANRAQQGWIDSYYSEQTMNRIPQEVSRGVQLSASPDSELFVMAQDTDGSDADHKRVGLSIKAKTIRAKIMISGRGSASGYPPDEGDESGHNQVRLLGVCYKTFDDYTKGLAQVLEFSDPSSDVLPAILINSFFKKQSDANWRIWYDKVFAVPFTTQHKRLEINYKVPPSLQKMVYPLATVGPPDTNIFVLYAMTGVRKNDHNLLTFQANYRCTYEK